MTDIELRQIYAYIDSFSTPVEADFFKPEQLKALEAERAKYKSSQELVAAIIDKEDFEERVQKATVDGKIYSMSQMHAVDEKLTAIDDQYGVRVDSNETLVSPTGQRIIMSSRLSGVIAYTGDTYMLKDELPKLVSGLQSDGVPGPLVDKVTAAMNKYGTILLQDGVFLVLKPMLEEAVGHVLPSFNPASAKAAPAVPAAPAAPSKPIDQLPFSFIEYLKNSDKEFDRVEHEVVKDPVFLEFFGVLQKQYDYYKTLPVDRMAGEVIIRPQLWARLSPQTRTWVQNIVTRNRDEFLAKVKQVAQAAQVQKLEELKRVISK